MRCFYIIAICVVLGGCSEALTARGKPAIFDQTARATFDATTSCVIRAMNEGGRYNSSLTNDMTHAAQIIEPNRIVEIHPQRTITVGAEVYYSRVTYEAKDRTRIELFATGVFADAMRGPVAACAS